MRAHRTAAQTPAELAVHTQDKEASAALRRNDKIAKVELKLGLDYYRLCFLFLFFFYKSIKN